jgi:hypothetical protein
MSIVCPYSLCKKNRELKNLDLLYLKIYMRSVADFWICCVLYHAWLLYQKLHKVML